MAAPASATEFIVIFQSAWMNNTGFGIDYSWDGRRFTSRDAAVAHGFAIAGDDDFNLGQLEHGRLTCFTWMRKVLDHDLAEISLHIGLVSR